MQEVSRSYDQADENARQVVRRTRNVTRRKYTPEEKVRIVIEGIRAGRYQSAPCAGERESTPGSITSGSRTTWRQASRG